MHRQTPNFEPGELHDSAVGGTLREQTDCRIAAIQSCRHQWSHPSRPGSPRVLANQSPPCFRKEKLSLLPLPGHSLALLKQGRVHQGNTPASQTVAKKPPSQTCPNLELRISLSASTLQSPEHPIIIVVVVTAHQQTSVRWRTSISLPRGNPLDVSPAFLARPPMLFHRDR